MPDERTAGGQASVIIIGRRGAVNRSQKGVKYEQQILYPKVIPWSCEASPRPFPLSIQKGALSFGNQVAPFCEMSLGFFEVLFHMITFDTIAQRREASQCDKSSL